MLTWQPLMFIALLTATNVADLISASAMNTLHGMGLLSELYSRRVGSKPDATGRLLMSGLAVQSNGAWFLDVFSCEAHNRDCDVLSEY